jgi:prevent-host-death family protein
MPGAVRKFRGKEVPLSKIKDDLSRFLCEAKKQEIVITRHGKPPGVLIGFESEDDWFDSSIDSRPAAASGDRSKGKHEDARKG